MTLRRGVYNIPGQTSGQTWGSLISPFWQKFENRHFDVALAIITQLLLLCNLYVVGPAQGL